jgi:Flp pilus assembly pilin Flp
MFGIGLAQRPVWDQPAAPVRSISLNPEPVPQSTAPGPFPAKEASMFGLLKKLVRSESGQDLAEYGIALAVIAVGAGAVAVVVAGNVNTLWTNASAAIAAAV